MKQKIVVPVVLALSVFVPASFADMVTPGGPAGAPDILGVGASSTLKASILNATITAATFTATYSEWVFADPSNVFCAGCLDFVFQVTNNGADVIGRLTNGSFSAFKVDAGIDMTGINPSVLVGGVIPQAVDEDLSGAVGFEFQPSPSITSGQHSAVLEIETNATQFTSGFISAQDNSASSGAAFEPFVPPTVPEPFTMGLLGSGLALVGFAGWRRRVPAIKA
jgi:hypothetical protein